MVMSARFKGIEDKQVSKRGQWFLPGKYKVKINAVKWVDAQVGSKSYVIVETTVLASNNESVPVGAERSQVIDMSNVMGLPNVKAFVAAASGVEGTSPSVNEEVCKYWSDLLEETVSFDEVCERICSEANPLEGEVMELECVNIKTKVTQEDFTRHNWFPRDVAA